MRIKDQLKPFVKVLPLLNEINAKKGIDPSLKKYIYLYSESPELMQTLENRVITVLNSNHITEYRLLIQRNLLYIENGSEFESDLSKWANTDNKCEAAKKIKSAYYQNTSSLDLSSFKLSSLPDCMKSLIFLCNLNLDRTDLKTVPAWIGDLVNLKTLSLQHNALTTLPKELNKCTQLENLYLSYNSLSQIPEVIFELKAIRTLQLSFCFINNIPKSISQAETLEKLDLESNQLEALPQELEDLSKLNSLQCGNNRFKEIPSVVFRLTNLQELSFEHNEIITLPDDIKELSNLKDLNLKHNKIQTCGIGLFSLPNLNFLNLSENSLVQFEGTEASAFWNLSSLVYLYLSSNQLEDLPLDMKKYFDLEILDLCDNPKLKMLPLSLGQCTHLATIDCTNTSVLPELPLAILNQVSNRYENTHLLLSLLIDKFSAVYGEEIQFTFTDTLEESDLKILIDWLQRSEFVIEMKTSPKDYARFLIDLLKSLQEGGEYNKLFLQQVSLNNEDCEDRTAISNAHLYCLWQLEVKMRENTLKDKLTLAVRLGKTIALRKKVSQIISEFENEHAMTHKEQAEIYLFAETELKEELGLETICKHMAYREVGKQEFVCLNTIKTFVNKNYLAEVASFDSVKNLAKHDPLINAKLENLNERLENECIYNPKDKEIEFLEKAKKLKQEFEEQEIALISAWIKRILK